MQQKPRNQRLSLTPRIVPKRSLGQNFLHDPRVIQKIVASLNLDPTDWVLEIGCGTGALTQFMAGKVQQFVGIELDSALFERLHTSFAGPRARFLNQDVLSLDLHRLVEELSPKPQKLKVVGNLPYYISSPILEWSGRHSRLMDFLTIMLQSEVADRLLATSGSKEYGVLTVLCQYHFLCRRLFDVNPAAFRPIPKVSSAVVRLEPKPARMLNFVYEPEFFAFVKQCFFHRRKTLRNCLKGKVLPERLNEVLKTLGKSAEVRAEALDLEEFVTLFKKLR
jgi:16S rRNA (adenine1518-N6/adenine1519-N6)-dimethyltransferase